jgi:hypothetical protein
MLQEGHGEWWQGSAAQHPPVTTGYQDGKMAVKKGG